MVTVLLLLMGLNGVMYAQAIADALTTIVTIFFAINIHRRLNIALYKRDMDVNQ